MKKLIIILVTATSILTSCTKEDLQVAEMPATPKVTIELPNVDPELAPYFERFYNEAQSRGIHIDESFFQIQSYFEDIPNENIAGVCRFNPTEPNKIVVDINFWSKVGDKTREMILFHELGHCYLERDHREDEFSNGQCKSLMRSGATGCVDAYSGEANYYLDELFDEQFQGTLAMGG